MLRRKIVGVFLLYAFLLPTLTFGQTSPKIYEAPKETLDKIREEGTKNSQIMKTLGYLSDVIGPRLTASPGMKRAEHFLEQAGCALTCRSGFSETRGV